MLFRQLLHEPLSAASYLIGCEAAGTAVVVDPSLPAERYALLAADRGLRITAVLETHMHADYVSTGRAVAALTGARIYLPRLANACFPHTPIDDGWHLHIGSIQLLAIHTPGHTPEHVAFAVSSDNSEEPWFVLTGDCLFVGDVGRADLVDLPQSGPEALFASLHRLLALPDLCEVYPTHYGGSACGGAGMSGKPASTIGHERRNNSFLCTDLPTFKTMLAETARTPVANVLHTRNINRGEHALPSDYGALGAEIGDAAAFSLERAAAMVRDGVALLDIRDRMAFAAQYPRGALSATYSRTGLTERAAALTDPATPLLVIADWPFLARYAAELLRRTGRNPVVGFVDAPADRWHEVAPTAYLATLSVDELHGEVKRGSQIVDVRAAHEQEQGCIAGAFLIPLAEIRTRLEQLSPERRTVVVCESGIRAVSAASLLQSVGFSDVAAVAPEGMSKYCLHMK